MSAPRHIISRRSRYRVRRLAAVNPADTIPIESIASPTTRLAVYPLVPSPSSMKPPVPVPGKFTLVGDLATGGILVFVAITVTDDVAVFVAVLVTVEVAVFVAVDVVVPISVAVVVVVVVVVAVTVAVLVGVVAVTVAVTVGVCVTAVVVAVTGTVDVAVTVAVDVGVTVTVEHGATVGIGVPMDGVGVGPPDLTVNRTETNDELHVGCAGGVYTTYRISCAPGAASAGMRNAISNFPDASTRAFARITRPSQRT